MDDFERKWQLIRDELSAQATGTERPRIASTRTLFGIKSSVETAMDAFAQKIQDEYAARRAAPAESGQEVERAQASEGGRETDKDGAGGRHADESCAGRIEQTRRRT